MQTTRQDVLVVPVSFWNCSKCRNHKNLLYYEGCTNECGIINTDFISCVAHIVKNLLKEDYPEWSNISIDNLTTISSSCEKNSNSDKMYRFTMQRFTNTFSSKLYLISDNFNYDQCKLRSFVLRFYNPSRALTSEQHYQISHIFGNQLNIAPKVIANFTGGHIEEYLNGYTNVDRINHLLNDETIYKQIAIIIAKIHCVDLGSSDSSSGNHNGNNQITRNSCNAYRTLSKLVNKGILLMENGSETHETVIYLKSFVQKNNFDLDKEWKWLQMVQMKYINNDTIYIYNKTTGNKLKLFKMGDLVLSHCDLNPRNILINKNDNNQVKVVDFEDSGYNQRVYDICKYFCHVAIDNNLNNFKMNFDTQYPNISYRTKFIKYYLNECIESKFDYNINEYDKYHIDNQNISKFIKAIDIGVLSSHLIISSFWLAILDKTWTKKYVLQRFSVYLEFKSNVVERYQLDNCNHINHSKL